MTGHTYPMMTHPPTGPIIGHWIAVEHAMPDDGITCLVWSQHLDDATLAAHDTSLLERRTDTGWTSPDGRAVLGVTHWCDDITPPPDPKGQNA